MADPKLRGWSNLPKNILVQILDRMNARVYRNLLRSVCPTWRSALPLSDDDVRHLPLQSLQIPLPIAPADGSKLGQTPQYDKVAEKIFFLVKPLDHVDCIDHSWLIHVKETGPNRLSFFNPLTGEKIYWPNQLRPRITPAVSLLQFRIIELGRSFLLRDTSKDESGFKKLQVCSAENPDIMALFDDGGLGFLQQGSNQWTRSDPFGDSILFEDCVSYKGRLYALDGKGRLVMFDPALREHVPVISSPLVEKCTKTQHYLYLVVSEGSLYLVLKTRDRMIHGLLAYSGYHYYDQRIATKVEVYVLKEMGARAKWVRVKSIGDRVFFVGEDASFSMDASMLDQSMRNCIFLGVLSDSSWHDLQYGLNAWIYDLNKGEVVLFDSMGYDSLQGRLFYPIPCWVHPERDEHLLRRLGRMRI